MDNNFRGKRAACNVYDDAMCYTPEERETYLNMLANRSYDTGLNILDDKFWFHGDDSVEFIALSPQILHDKITAERDTDILTMIEEFLEKHPLDKIIKINGNEFYNTNLMKEQ